MLQDTLKKAVGEYNNGEYSKAITTLLVCDYNEDDFEVFYYLGLCYIKLGDYNNAKENLLHSVRYDDNLLRIFQTRMLIAYSFIMLQDYKDAESELRSLLDSGYESAKLYSLLGYTYYKTEMIHKSITNYRKALAIDSENANALNSLGYILSDYKEDLREAETLCRRALSINVDNPAYLDSLGWVCCRNNKLSASFSFFERALKLAPDNEVIKEHMSQLNKLRFV